MKQSFNRLNLRAILFLVVATLIQAILWAQDTTTTSKSVTTTTTSETTWYSSPWVWVAGGAVFILLLIALLRGGGNKSTAGRTDKVTVTKTTRSETDTD